LGAIVRSLRHSLRSLKRDTGFTVTVIVTIAVCIAANTATFAVVNSVLLRPLPVPDVGSILLMPNRYPKAGADFGFNSASGDYYDRLGYVHVFSEQALFRTAGRTIEIQGTPQRVTGMLATGIWVYTRRNLGCQKWKFGSQPGNIFTSDLFCCRCSALG
jgi:hypothetical protein